LGHTFLFSYMQYTRLLTSTQSSDYYFQVTRAWLACFQASLRQRPKKRPNSRGLYVKMCQLTKYTPMLMFIFPCHWLYFTVRRSLLHCFWENSNQQFMWKGSGMILTIYITVLVTRVRHFGARESVWSYFFEAKPRKNIGKTDSRASKWLPRSQKQCWIKLYLTFGSKMDQYYNMAQGSS
jgi:hypothetical protein